MAVASLAVLPACGSDERPSAGSSVSAPPPPASSSIDEPAVPVVAVYEGVVFYPACGNESLEHRGVTWYPVVHVGSEERTPELQDAIDAVQSVEREDWTPPRPQGFVRVAPPGPGDDIGTMAVWADGVARWVSESGDLDVWMVDDEIEYSWIC